MLLAYEMMRSSRSIYEFRRYDLEGDADCYNGHPCDGRPHCGGWEAIWKGKDRSGLKRYACKACGRRFPPMTGTVFEGAKLPAFVWAGFRAPDDFVRGRQRHDWGGQTVRHHVDFGIFRCSMNSAIVRTRLSAGKSFLFPVMRSASQQQAAS